MAKNTVGAQLAEILNDYENALDETVQKEIDRVAKNAASKLRNDSPRLTGDYASGWRVKKDRDGEAIVYNKNDPQITHLLEFGHASPNGGRVPARVHIKPVEEWANEELVQRVESKIRGGLT